MAAGRDGPGSRPLGPVEKLLPVGVSHRKRPRAQVGKTRPKLQRPQVHFGLVFGGFQHQVLKDSVVQTPKARKRPLPRELFEGTFIARDAGERASSQITTPSGSINSSYWESISPFRARSTWDLSLVAATGKSESLMV
ncbi:TPA: hypothetical protein DCL37_08570 [Candidatus Acetothermia bacterium]|nr:hypothetical protein [Candidatus Acetothermia bacterium]